MNFRERHPFIFTDEHSEAVTLRDFLREQDYDRVGTTTSGGSLLDETFFKGNLRVEINYRHYVTQPIREED